MLSLGLVVNYATGALILRSITGIMSTMMMIEEGITKIKTQKRIDGHSNTNKNKKESRVKDACCII